MKIASLGLSAHDETILRSMLKLLAGKTAAVWEYTPLAESNLVVIAHSCAEALAQLRQAGGKLLMLYGPREAAPLERAALRLAAPLRVMNLLDCLNDAAERLSSAPAPAGSAGRRRAPLASLLRVLAEERRDGAFSIDGLPGESVLIVLPAEATFYYGGALESLASLDDAAVVQAHRLSAEERGALPAAGKARPLAALLWVAALHAGRGRLLPWLDEHAAFKLTRWPDFGALGNRPGHAKLAAHLLQRPAALASLAQASALPLAAAADFVNACVAAGYARPAAAGAAGEPRRPAAAAGSLPLFARIRRKLGL